MSQLCQQQEKILDVLALLVAQKDQTTKRLSSPTGSPATAVKSGDNQSQSSQSLSGPSSSEDRYPRSLPHSGPSTPSESSGFTPFRQPPSFASPSSQSIRLSPPFSNPTANQPRSSQSLPSLASSEDRYPRSLPHSGPSAPSESSGFTPFRQPPSFASPSSQSIGLSPPFSNPTASPVSHFQAYHPLKIVIHSHLLGIHIIHAQGPPLLLNHHPSVSRQHLLHPLLSPLVCPPLHSQIQPIVVPHSSHSQPHSQHLHHRALYNLDIIPHFQHTLIPLAGHFVTLRLVNHCLLIQCFKNRHFHLAR